MEFKFLKRNLRLFRMEFKPLRKILHKILHKKGKSVNFECFVCEIRAKSKLREKLNPL